MKKLKQFICKHIWISPIRNIPAEKGYQSKEYECADCGKRLIIKWKK